MGLTRLWAGARAANPATHHFPVSIPYHGCALNITVQSYLDQLDFGMVACCQTVPDAQRIAVSLAVFQYGHLECARTEVDHVLRRCASHYGGRDKLSFVRVGTLDDPSAVAPDVHNLDASVDRAHRLALGLQQPVGP